MILRHVGYDGALAGWEPNDRGWRLRADWFSPSDRGVETARQLYEAHADSSREETTRE
jgi:hypothetical protein